MEMYKPAHPGEILREMYLTPLDLSVTETAKALGVTRKTFSELINYNSSVSIPMALKLSKAFDTTPEYWLNLQQNYDLWEAKKKIKLNSVKVLLKSQIV
ncbi:MAG: HigA family addiction module antitoxin [Spirochaetota bacterium]